MMLLESESEMFYRLKLSLKSAFQGLKPNRNQTVLCQVHFKSAQDENWILQRRSYISMVCIVMVGTNEV